MKARQYRIHRWLQGLILGVFLCVLDVSVTADNLLIEGRITVTNMTADSLTIPASTYLPSEVFSEGNNLRIKGPTRTSPGGTSGNLVLSGGDGSGSAILAGKIILNSVVNVQSLFSVTSDHDIEVWGGVIRGADWTGAPSSYRTLTLRGGSGSTGVGGNVEIRPGWSPTVGHILLDGVVIVSNNMTLVSDLVVGGGITAHHAEFIAGASIGGISMTNGSVRDVQAIQLGDLDVISHEGETNFLYVVNGTSTGRVAILWD